MGIMAKLGIRTYGGKQHGSTENDRLPDDLPGYRGEKYLNIFYKILGCCKTYFADEYGEWYGYLRRDGKPTQPPCKGSTFKGPFHVPRCLIPVDQIMTQLLGE